MDNKNGFIRFCGNPELACCRTEKELFQLRAENATLRAELEQVKAEREALSEFAIGAVRDFTECDKMYLHISNLRQQTGFNAYLIDAKQSGAAPLTLEQWLTASRKDGVNGLQTSTNPENL